MGELMGKFENDIKKYVEQELYNYSNNVRILSELKHEGKNISSSKINIVPASRTNKFVSSTETLALNENKDIKTIKQDIRRVDIWLGALKEQQLHVVKGVYIDRLSMNSIIARYNKRYSSSIWEARRKEGIKTICDVVIGCMQYLG
jgi:hypothetical protein